MARAPGSQRTGFPCHPRRKQIRRSRLARGCCSTELWGSEGSRPWAESEKVCLQLFTCEGVVVVPTGPRTQRLPSPGPRGSPRGRFFFHAGTCGGVHPHPQARLLVTNGCALLVRGLWLAGAPTPLAPLARRQQARPSLWPAVSSDGVSGFKDRVGKAGTWREIWLESSSSCWAFQQPASRPQDTKPCPLQGRSRPPLYF